MTVREQIKEILRDYLGSDLSNNLEQYSTPENVLLEHLMALIERLVGKRREQKEGDV